MNRCLFALLVVCSVAASILCGCGSSSPPPTITTTQAQLSASPAVAGAFFQFSFQASNPGTGLLTWSAIGLPADGLTLGSASGTILGTPISKANISFTLTVSDASGHASQGVPFTITVNNPPPPSITTTQAQFAAAPATSGSPYTFTFTANGGLAPLTWSESGSLPTGMSFDTVNGVLAGTPSVVNSFPITISVQDAAGQNSGPQNFTFTVNNPTPPVINTAPAPPIAVLNQFYSFTFTATNGLAPLTWSETGSLPPGLNFSTGGVLSGTPTTAGSYPITVMVTDSLSQSAAPQAFTIVAALGFSPTGSLQTQRFEHTATLLTTGKVLVVGGLSRDSFSFSGTLASAELYDSSSGSFSSSAGTLNTARFGQTATLLSDGRVLLAGGTDVSGTVLASAELYNPSSDTFSLAASDMQSSREGHTATLLNDGSGKVLITGGRDASGTFLASAELFDPKSNTFSATTGSMQSARQGHTATLLKTGKVLIAGGSDAAGELDTAELYDPATETFTPTTMNMNAARADHTATLLQDGRVLIVGGGSAEIYDPSADTFTSIGSLPFPAGQAAFTAVLRNDGTVLISGGVAKILRRGCLPLRESVDSSLLYDPASGSFTQTGNLSPARANHTATLLPNGQVLIVGGITWRALFPPPFPPGSGCGSQSYSVTPTAELFP
jgi:hypothetical protein